MISIQNKTISMFIFIHKIHRFYMEKADIHKGKMIKIESNEDLSFDKDSNFSTLLDTNHFNGIKDLPRLETDFHSFWK